LHSNLYSSIFKEQMVFSSTIYRYEKMLLIIFFYSLVSMIESIVSHFCSNKAFLCKIYHVIRNEIPPVCFISMIWLVDIWLDTVVETVYHVLMEEQKV